MVVYTLPSGWHHSSGARIGRAGRWLSKQIIQEARRLDPHNRTQHVRRDTGINDDILMDSVALGNEEGLVVAVIPPAHGHSPVGRNDGDVPVTRSQVWVIHGRKPHGNQPVHSVVLHDEGNRVGMTLHESGGHLDPGRKQLLGNAAAQRHKRDPGMPDDRSLFDVTPNDQRTATHIVRCGSRDYVSHTDAQRFRNAGNRVHARLRTLMHLLGYGGLVDTHHLGKLPLGEADLLPQSPYVLSNAHFWHRRNLGQAAGVPADVTVLLKASGGRSPITSRIAALVQSCGADTRALAIARHPRLSCLRRALETPRSIGLEQRGGPHL